MTNRALVSPEALSDQYNIKEFTIQGAIVSAIFPKNGDGSVMNTVKEMLVHSYVSTYGDTDDVIDVAK